MIELVGKNIRLRTLEREHCRQLWQEYEPEQPVATEPTNPGYSVEGAELWFEDMQKAQGKTQVYLGIFLTDGILTGDIQLANIDWRHRTASLGISITKREHRGRGYATDAVLVLVKYAFEELDLFRLTARTLEHNTAARKVLENTGFIQEGCERQAVTIAGRRWDRLVFGLLRSDLV
ncbi:MAG: N-acetyltransferase [Anaerolineales bacterium]|nr:MAG: N-acetyltransferase [Anaerolineales bacterium]